MTIATCAVLAAALASATAATDPVEPPAARSTPLADPGTPAPEPIAREAAEAVRSAWALSYENDVFVGSDRYYTNGVQLSLSRSGLGAGRLQPVLETACRALGCVGDALELVHDRVGQVIYTPARISIARPQPDDRPWAGMLFYAREYELVDEAHEQRTVLTGLVGIVGPASGAAEVQRWIHRTFDKAEPRGWHNQIGGELGLMAMVERRQGLLQLSSGARDPVAIHATTSWRVAAGNIATFAAVGATVAVGRDLDRTLPRLTGFTPGSLQSGGPCLFEWLQCMAFASVDARLMLRNVFLDGALFRSGPSVDSRPVVVDSSLGLRFGLPRTRNVLTGPVYASLTVTRRSPEFDSATRHALWQEFGSLTVGTDF